MLNDSGGDRVPENRQHPRKQLHPPVAFQLGDAPRVDAECHDISLGGMFVQTPHVAPYGAKIRVFLTLPELKGEAVVDSIVRWSKPDGMGIQFGVMGARETYALTKLLTG
jgi:hypothetical protein